MLCFKRTVNGSLAGILFCLFNASPSHAQAGFLDIKSESTVTNGNVTISMNVDEEIPLDLCDGQAQNMIVRRQGGFTTYFSREGQQLSVFLLIAWKTADANTPSTSIRATLLDGNGKELMGLPTLECSPIGAIKLERPGSNVVLYGFQLEKVLGTYQVRFDGGTPAFPVAQVEIRKGPRFP